MFRDHIFAWWKHGLNYLIQEEKFILKSDIIFQTLFFFYIYIYESNSVK